MSVRAIDKEKNGLIAILNSKKMRLKELNGIIILKLDK